MRPEIHDNKSNGLVQHNLRLCVQEAALPAVTMRPTAGMRAGEGWREATYREARSPPRQKCEPEGRDLRSSQ